MKNIFEGAKFGDKFITRDGRKAVYLKESDLLNSFQELIIEDMVKIIVWPTGKVNTDNLECLNDIVSKWKEPIDENKLDTLADDFCGKFDFEPTQRNPTDSGWEYGHTYTQLVDCYKAGYHKAKEE